MYRGETVLYGKFKGLSIDTVEKAEGYIDWQVSQGFLTDNQAKYQKVVARNEFNGVGNCKPKSARW